VPNKEVQYLLSLAGKVTGGTEPQFEAASDGGMAGSSGGIKCCLWC
jgi:hypothetical protein